MHIERLRWMRFRWILPPRFPWPNGPWSLAQGFNPGNRISLRRALKGLQIPDHTRKATRQSHRDLSPLQDKSSCSMLPRVETLG